MVKSRHAGAIRRDSFYSSGRHRDRSLSALRSARAAGVFRNELGVAPRYPFLLPAMMRPSRPLQLQPCPRRASTPCADARPAARVFLPTPAPLGTIGGQQRDSSCRNSKAGGGARKLEATARRFRGVRADAPGVRPTCILMVCFALLLLRLVADFHILLLNHSVVSSYLSLSGVVWPSAHRTGECLAGRVWI